MFYRLVVSLQMKQTKYPFTKCCILDQDILLSLHFHSSKSFSGSLAHMSHSVSVGLRGDPWLRESQQRKTVFFKWQQFALFSTWRVWFTVLLWRRYPKTVYISATAYNNEWTVTWLARVAPGFNDPCHNIYVQRAQHFWRINSYPHTVSTFT